MAIDIEALVISFLCSEGYDAFADVPAERPDRFVTVERLGGGKDDIVIDRPSVAIQCWDTSRRAAAELAYEVDALIGSMTALPDVSRVERDSLYNFPDETGSNARYQIVVDLVTT